MNSKTILRIINRILAIGLVTYALVYGMLITLPYRGPILGHTSRNIFYHVPMWFAMMILGYTSVVYSILYLRGGNIKDDIRAKASAQVSLMFGGLGLATGIVWSRVTWGENMPGTDLSAWWAWDPKQTSALICILIYSAYFLLRRSFEEPVQRAKIAAVYNIFAAASIYPLFYLLPKALDGLHPGAEGEAATVFDMSPEFNMIFWPAIIGFVNLAIWIHDVKSNMEWMKHEISETES